MRWSSNLRGMDKQVATWTVAAHLFFVCGGVTFAQNGDELHDSFERNGWVSTLSLSHTTDRVAIERRSGTHRLTLTGGLYWELTESYFAVARWPIFIEAQLSESHAVRAVVSGDPSVGAGVAIAVDEADVRFRVEYTLPLGPWREDDATEVSGSGFHDVTFIASWVRIWDPALIDLWLAASFGARVERVGTRINPGVFSLGVAVTEALNEYVALSVWGEGTIALPSVIEGHWDGEWALSQQAGASIGVAIGDRSELDIGMNMGGTAADITWTTEMSISYYW